MTDQQHPITPTEELMRQWVAEIWHKGTPLQVAASDIHIHIATRAAQWGADQELEALVSWLRSKNFDHMANDLLAARRPKPPSLKEQALGAMGRFNVGTHTSADEMNRDFATIRRALEQLND